MAVRTGLTPGTSTLSKELAYLFHHDQSTLHLELLPVKTLGSVDLSM